jgi:pyruvate dehydrogenase E2 component (dihydrolipoamide acetyltransferase)
MPTLGLTMEEGTIVEWFRKPGESFKEGDALFSVETDKAVLDVEAEADGVLVEVLVAAGELAAVGVAIATIRTRQDEKQGANAAPVVPATERKAAQAEPVAIDVPVVSVTPAPAPVAAATTGRVAISPAARKAASEAGVDLASLNGSGPNGRIILRDLPVASAVATDSSGVWTALTPMRRAIVGTVTQSMQVPQFRITHSVDLTRLLAFRAALQPYWERSDARVSLSDFFMQASSIALVSFPQVNASFEDGPSGAGIRQHGTVNIANALAMESGLMAPVLHGTQAMSLVEIARARIKLTAAAQSGNLSAQNMVGATFMISNLGPLGIDQFDAMVTPPMAAVLAIGRVANRMVAEVNGTSSVRPTVILTLTSDHRVIDGALAARFLAKLSSVLEQAEEFRLFQTTLS